MNNWYQGFRTENMAEPSRKNVLYCHRVKITKFELTAIEEHLVVTLDSRFIS